MSAGRTSVLRRRAWASFVFYALDMAFALASFTIGFGLSVQNWWAFVVIGLLGRWSMHVLSSALMYATARERVEEDRKAGAPQ